jgi:hypothetical protein
VGPDDLSVSRFGEVKVSLFGRRRALPPDVDGLRSLLRALLATVDECPPAVRAAAEGAVDDDAGLVRILQRAQQEAGRPVTELPSEAPTAPAPSGTELAGLSDALTAAPAPPPRRRRGVPASGGTVLLVLGALAVLAVTATQRATRPPPSTTAAAAPSPVTSHVGSPPPDSPLHVADFTAPRWAPSEKFTTEASVVDGVFRIHVSKPPAWRTFFVWGPPAGESRLSVTVHARMTGAGAELGIICGQPDPASKALSAYVGVDGSWKISTNEGVVATGSAPERRPELGEPFALRLDCATKSSPTRAALFLNDRVLGEADGSGAFPIDGISIAVSTSGIEPFVTPTSIVTYDPFDLAIVGITVRRLG